MIWPHHKDNCDRIGTKVTSVLCRDCNKIVNNCSRITEERLAVNMMPVLHNRIRNETTVSNPASVSLVTRLNFDRIMSIMTQPVDPDTPHNQDGNIISGVTFMTLCPDPAEQGNTVDKEVSYLLVYLLRCDNEQLSSVYGKVLLGMDQDSPRELDGVCSEDAGRDNIWNVEIFINCY